MRFKDEKSMNIYTKMERKKERLLQKIYLILYILIKVKNKKQFNLFLLYSYDFNNIIYLINLNG